MNTIRILAFVVVGVAVSCGLVLAQTGRGSISGTVRDRSGAVVPNAHVTVTNAATGIAHATSVTHDGFYVVPNLTPGNYTVEVNAAGFKRARLFGLSLAVDQQLKADVTLEVGSLTQQVTVSGVAATLQTNDASVGTVIGSQEVLDLPLNGRFFTQLLELAPGTVPAIHSPLFTSTNPNTAGKERNGMPVFDTNGETGDFVVSRIDGIENTEREFGGQNIPISIDAIDEFKLQTADFSAEYGRGPAQIDIVTKSGTNNIHGTLFEFVRNTALDATQWTFTGAHTGDLLHRNQFGGNLGGPIRKDKLFYFFNFRRHSRGLLRTRGYDCPVDQHAEWSFSERSDHLRPDDRPALSKQYDTAIAL